MATISKTTAGRFNDVAGVRRRTVGVYTGPTSYVNPGGDTILANELGLGVIEKLALPEVIPDSAGASLRVLVVNYSADRTSVTVRWFTALVTEVANAVDLSAYSVTFEAVGR